MIKFYATKNGSVLSNIKPHISRSLIGKIKQNGSVLVGGECCKMSQMVHVGDEITINLPKRACNPPVPYFCDLQVRFEDSSVIVLQKPAGMQTHCSKSDNKTTLENAYCGLLASRKEDISSFTFHAITRLDKETSGLVLVCKNPIATAKMSQDIQNGKVEKCYIALASGHISSSFTCQINMERVCEGAPQRWQKQGGKQSETNFEVVKNIGENTLVRAFPKTGRTHQIRVHLAFSGHAIVGDKLYENGGILQGEKPSGRLMLFMHKLTFENMCGKWITVVSSDKELMEYGI